MICSIESSPAVQTDITVILRSAGERTKHLCYQLLREQVPPENIVVVDERPFTQALRRSFELGAELGRPWTLCVDADTLLRRTSIGSLLKWGRVAGSTVFQVQSNLFDKLFGFPRKAGVRLYRTSLLPKALGCIPGQDASPRPETFVRDQMSLMGFPSQYHKATVGVHDFEQFFRDIYRKGFVHAHKHAKRAAYFQRLWEHLAVKDPDYHVALWGLHDGQLSRGIPLLDVRHYPRNLSELLSMRGWEEKKELDSSLFAGGDIDKLIVEYGELRISSNRTTNKQRPR
jgi:hypothetical protein